MVQSCEAPHIWTNYVAYSHKNIFEEYCALRTNLAIWRSVKIFPLVCIDFRQRLWDKEVSVSQKDLWIRWLGKEVKHNSAQKL